MNSTQIIKLRLAQLKKMSIELKESTQNSQTVDYELVSDILEATKSSAQKVNQMKRGRDVKARGRMGNGGNVEEVKNSVQMPYLALFPQTVQKNQPHYHTPQSYKQSFHSQNQQSQHPIPITYSQYSLTKPHHPLTSYSNYSDTQHNPFTPPSNDNPFYPPQQQFIGQLYPDHNTFNDYPNIINHPYSDSQVLKLREQNNNLQRTIVTMRDQIFQLRQKVQRVTKQQQWKTGLPYFHLSEQISAMYTRLTINQHDYGKIDYNNYSAQLTLQKLTIKKMLATTTTTTIPKQLYMNDLKQVRYIDSIVMLLQFGYDNNTISEEGRLQSYKKQQLQLKDDDRSQNQFEQSVFIRFNNEQQLHKWDLALYINFNLVNSIKRDRLFSTYIKQSRSISSRNRNKSLLQSKRLNDSLVGLKRENDLIGDGDNGDGDGDNGDGDGYDGELMKRLEYQQKQYLETKRLISQRMIDKASQKKLILKSSRENNNNKLSKQQQSEEQFSQTHQMDFQNQNITDRQHQNQRLQFNYKYQHQNQNSSRKQTQKNNDSSAEMSRIETSGFYDFTNLQLPATKVDHKPTTIQPVENVFIPPLNLSGKKIQKQLSFSPQENNQKLMTKSKKTPLPQQQKPNNSTNIHTNNNNNEPSPILIKQQQQTRIPSIIDKFTQQGYDLTKYSKDGFNPHQKRFFLSDDLKRLFWQQQGGRNKKFVDLKAIKQVQPQKIGEGIRKHIKRPKKEQHCIISYVKDNKVKVIELGANVKVMGMFVEQLTLLLEHLNVLRQKD